MSSQYSAFKDDFEPADIDLTGNNERKVSNIVLNNLEPPPPKVLNVLNDQEKTYEEEGEKVKKIRLRAVETEAEYFLKLLNGTTLRNLSIIQAVASGTIFFFQILLYVTVQEKRNYKAVDYTGIGVWAPLFFFFIASGLTYLASRSPSGCIIGTSIGFQVASAIVCVILFILTIISIMMHGYYSFDYTNSDTDSRVDSYNPEIPGKVFCCFMLAAGAVVIITSIFINIHFCKAVCCGRARILESVMFDVETSKE